MHAAAAEGRPFWGTLVKPVFAAAGMIDNLRFVRIVTVAGIVALALLLYWALVRSKIGRLLILIALLVRIVPFQLAIVGDHFFFAVGHAAGRRRVLLAGAKPWMRRVGLQPARVGDGSADRGADPPAGGDVLLGLPAEALAGTVLDSERCVAPRAVQFAVAAVALGLAALMLFVLVWLVGTDAPMAGRGAFTTDVVGEAEWFAHFGLHGSLNLFDLTWSPGWRLVAGCGQEGILFWLLRREAAHALHRARSDPDPARRPAILAVRGPRLADRKNTGLALALIAL